MVGQPNRRALSRRLLLAASALAACVVSWSAVADASAAAGGGLSPGGTPRLKDATCLSRCIGVHRATPGATVRLTGSFLEETNRVVFKGVAGPVAAPYSARESGAVEVQVPTGAASGRLYVVNEGGVSSNPSPQTLEVLPPSSLPRQVFPIRGPHEYWAGFGDGRGHQGADVGARCGTPLVAVAAGKLTMNEYHSRAGNYAVIDLKGADLDLAYMHMVEPSPLLVGQSVSAGQVIGYTGETGNAAGCHLHFELWEGEYYGGGAPVDPIPFLKSLEPGRAKRAG